MAGYADELSVKLSAQDEMSQKLKAVRKEIKETEKAMVAARRDFDNTGAPAAASELKRLENQWDRLNRSQKDFSRSSGRIKKDLDQMKGKAAQTSTTVGGLGKSLAKVAAAAAAFVSVQAVTRFMEDSIQKGSALQESLSKTSTVFGASSAAIVEWSESSSTAMGLSQQAALEAVSTYGNLFQAFGIGREKASEMSTTLVQLASDLASFNNTSVDDALVALRSGLSGETEPLKRYGIALTDARMKAEALSLGIWDGKGALDAAQKSQAAYVLMMKDSSLAQGDFARTSDGYANTMRILTAEVDNAKAEIGTELIGAIEKAAQAFGGPEGLSVMIGDAGTAMADFVAGIGGAVDSLGSLINGINDVVKVGENGFVDLMMSVDRLVNPVQNLISRTQEYGSELRREEEAKSKSIKASESLYAGYIATWDAAGKAADGIEDVGDEAEDAAVKVSALSAAVTRMNRLMNRGQALVDFGKAAKAFAGKQTSDTAAAFISSWNGAYSSFKDGSKAQARFVNQNYRQMKQAIQNSGIKKSIRNQMVDELDRARQAARDLLNELKSLDGTTVSIGINGINTLPQYRPMTRRASGGLVTGPGSGTSDSIPALLSNREYVIRAAAVDRIGVDTLNRLNHADRIPVLPSIVNAPSITIPASHAGRDAPLVGSMVVHAQSQVDVELALLRTHRQAERDRRTRTAGTR